MISSNLWFLSCKTTPWGKMLRIWTKWVKGKIIQRITQRKVMFGCLQNHPKFLQQVYQWLQPPCASRGQAWAHLDSHSVFLFLVWYRKWWVPVFFHPWSSPGFGVYVGSSSEIYQHRHHDGRSLSMLLPQVQSLLEHTCLSGPTANVSTTPAST